MIALGLFSVKREEGTQIFGSLFYRHWLRRAGVCTDERAYWKEGAGLNGHKIKGRIDLCAYAQRQIGGEAERDRSFCMPLMFSFPK